MRAARHRPRPVIARAQSLASTQFNKVSARADGATADVITSVMESAYYGKATSSSTGGGLVLVKTRRVLILATYADPVTAAEAIPHTHRFADSLEALLSEI